MKKEKIIEKSVYYPPSKTEFLLLRHMKEIGLSPIHHYKIGRIEPDFSFPGEKIVIEVDGMHHLTNEQRVKDGNRDDFLQSRGWKVRRFTAKETYENPGYTAIKIKNFIERSGLKKDLTKSKPNISKKSNFGSGKKIRRLTANKPYERPDDTAIKIKKSIEQVGLQKNLIRSQPNMPKRSNLVSHKNHLEKIMYWWAKLWSLVVIYFIFYAIYVGFFGIRTYLDIQETRLEAASLGSYMPNFLSFGDLIISLFGIVLSIIFGLYFYSPFFYYGWVKHSNNRWMRSFTKDVTIFLPIVILIGSITHISKFSDVLPILAMIFSMIPLYYYAWGK